MWLLKSLRKSRRLWRVAKRLNQSFDSAALINGKASYEKEEALKELLDICVSDDLVKLTMSRFKADETTLRELHSKLRISGAGRLVRGHYVAGSSLAFPPPLKFLLEHYRDGVFSIQGYDPLNSSAFIANRLNDYFERGETGEVKY